MGFAEEVSGEITDSTVEMVELSARTILDMLSEETRVDRGRMRQGYDNWAPGTNGGPVLPPDLDIAFAMPSGASIRRAMRNYKVGSQLTTRNKVPYAPKWEKVDRNVEIAVARAKAALG